jgi:hypothetical protein
VVAGSSASRRARCSKVGGTLSRCGGGCFAAGDCDGFESGVDAECAEEVTDVVPSRLGADVQLAGDLSGRVASLE